MRVTLILFVMLLLSVIYANSKRVKSDKRCSGEEKDEGRKKLKGTADSGEDDFRWNRNFKKHKQNTYDKFEKKKQPDVYKLKEKIREYAKTSGEVKKNKEKRSRTVTENVVDAPKPATTDLQCDSEENTCSASV
ncbi:hypothetical protein PPYR_14242 [Photinus pyralis]|uniref:Cathepsin propeptide inhibitor domain-containing protein n=1 Tax=Photinus pyralis TaxID=7054 RepID=A0A1Y1K0H3_PHOPY|nr:uncharacterized protein LOC116181038 [Photinus pyralis]KAB0792283.1 hypothetical protein PPYR_14242 [Photinus pyralis]